MEDRYIGNLPYELAQEFRRIKQERNELQATLDLIHDSDMRAIKAWQAAHPGKELVWPDRKEMIVWLLEQLKL